MLIAETLSVALGALRANALRSVLTMLGVVIGVGAVIAMVAIGQGAQKQIEDRLAALGTRLLTVLPNQQRMGGVTSAADRAPLDVGDAVALRDSTPFLSAVQAEVESRFQVQYRTRNVSVGIIGTTPNFLEVRNYEIDVGRMFTDREDEAQRRVAVLSPTLTEDLGVPSVAALLGEKIRIKGIYFTVIGITKPKGGAAFGNQPDEQILIPLTTARFWVHGGRRLRSISALAVSEAEIPQAMSEIQRTLRRRHKLPPGRPDNFIIRNQSEFLTTAAESSATFTALLAGIAGVSLLVGGIGIMNIMLVSVTERTREIGVRKALGATRLNILLQFLIESIVLCVAGGILGIAAGWGGATMLARSLGQAPVMSGTAVAIAFIFSVAVGLVFGVWPARRAAALDPIAALRYE